MAPRFGGASPKSLTTVAYSLFERKSSFDSESVTYEG